MGWRAKRFGPKITRAHYRLHQGLIAEGIPHVNNYYLMGKTRRWNVDVYIIPWLIIEVDGSSHVGKQLLKDEVKTADLQEAPLPFTVLRFWDREIIDNLRGCLNTIKRVLAHGRSLNNAAATSKPV